MNTKMFFHVLCTVKGHVLRRKILSICLLLRVFFSILFLTRRLDCIKDIAPKYNSINIKIVLKNMYKNFKFLISIEV